MSARDAHPAAPGNRVRARILSGMGLGAVAAFAVFAGGWYFDVLLAAILGVALFEFLRMAKSPGHPVPVGASLALGGVMILYTLVPLLPGRDACLALVAGALLLGTLRAPIAGRGLGLALGLLGVFYVVGLGLELHGLRHRDDGRAVLASVVLATWAADTAAFFVGVRWGRRALAPAVSPAKTVEGLVAGCVASVVVGAVVLVALGEEGRWGRGLLLGAVVAVAAPVGDLFESLLKRNFEVKDSSHLIPGHGGVFDRVDSLLLAGAAVGAMVRFFSW